MHDCGEAQRCTLSLKPPGPQRQGAAGHPRVETVPAQVTRRLEGAGMHQDIVTTIQWKGATPDGLCTGASPIFPFNLEASIGGCPSGNHGSSRGPR
jgi:hypothetical protein